MPVHVTDVEGREARVITEADQLESERTFKKWLVGVVASIIIAAFWIGVAFENLQSQTSDNRDRIEEVRTEGTIPGRILERRLDVMESQVALVLQRQQEILDAVQLIPRRR